jgi:dynein light chain Tctex-type 1
MVSVEDVEFPLEDVQPIVQRAIGKTLNDKTFIANEMDVYIGSCVRQILSDLSDLQKPFKYAVSMILTQKVGAGLASSATMFWDVETDCHASVTWENEELQAVVAVYCICTEAFAEHRPSHKEVMELSLEGRDGYGESPSARRKRMLAGGVTPTSRLKL